MEAAYSGELPNERWGVVVALGLLDDLVCAGVDGREGEVVVEQEVFEFGVPSRFEEFAGDELHHSMSGLEVREGGLDIQDRRMVSRGFAMVMLVW